jgi:LmbE family N-acetylglucosaminyl deacetylase
MRSLYIFPHPDDESFGPAGVMAKQRRQGHDVHLLTLTRGGATKRRFDLGLSVEQMGEVRLGEMRGVEQVLNLSGMTVLDLPDSGLKEMDPRDIEAAIRAEIERLRPDVVVTYAVYGASGFHDHIVTHAAVKHAYVELRDTIGSSPRRLAFYTLRQNDPVIARSPFGLQGSKEEEIDCIVRLDDEDVAAQRRALACYETYQQVIARTGVSELAPDSVPFEIFQEEHRPMLEDLFEELKIKNANSEER